MRWSFLSILLVTACSSAIGEHRASSAQASPSARATRVEVVEVRASEARIEFALPGEVEGWRDTELGSALGGYVEEVRVRAGDVVRRGDVLVRIDAVIHQAALDQARAQEARAKAELERVQRMGDLASQQQLLAVETEATVARAALENARARYARAVIAAPFDGVVATVHLDPGEVAGPGAAVLRLVQLDPVRVTLSVPDRDVVSLEAGLEVAVSVNARSGRFPGRIAHVGPAADLRTRAFPVEVEVPNPDGLLLPGMIARVAVGRSVADGAIVVPQDWIVTRFAEQGVFLAEDGSARWRPVELGAVVRDDVVVTAGLAPGDRVVVTGHRDLMEGDPLLVVPQGT